MTVQGKINSYVLGLVAVSAFTFFYAFPRIADSLVNLQSAHKDQVAQLQSLSDQVKALEAMQRDLSDIAKMPVQPKDLFTPYSADAKLVNEIQALENYSAQTNLVMHLNITGSAEKALPYPSASGLVAVPYTLTLDGNFVSAVQFLQYFENSFFVSPISDITISGAGDKAHSVHVTINAEFFLEK